MTFCYNVAQVAGRTAEKLDGQGEKIDQLGADVMEMGETLSGAREHIRQVLI